MGHIAPSDKVNLACVGIGNRGNEIIKALNNTGLCNNVALCDVDMGVMAPQMGVKLEFDRETRQIVNNPLANQVLAGMPPRKGWEEFYRV